jgi:hypothetical protein
VIGGVAGIFAHQTDEDFPSVVCQVLLQIDQSQGVGDFVETGQQLLSAQRFGKRVVKIPTGFGQEECQIVQDHGVVGIQLEGGLLGLFGLGLGSGLIQTIARVWSTTTLSGRSSRAFCKAWMEAVLSPLRR